ncbi:MAG: hypothetical protein LBR08_13145 [Bacteroidales bacterium]|jgi:hypothetical protein|nr:hypothetical protein [Bacteroidales bacterium]
MKKFFLFILCIGVMFSSCKKTGDGENEEVIDKTYDAKKFIGENIDAAKQTFAFKTSELPKTFTLKNGVKISIPAGTVFKKAGQAVSGDLTLEACAMLKPSDMILSGTCTNYIGWQGKRYLSSDGFAYIDVKHNERSVDQYLDYGQYINFSFPTDKGSDATTEVWQGEEADSSLIWEDIDERAWNFDGDQKWGTVVYSNKSFSFDFGKLGWVNCDVLWTKGAMTTVIVKLTGKIGALAQYQGYGNGDTFVFFVSGDVNVVAQLYTTIDATTVKSYDNSMPVGDKGSLIAFSVKEGEFSFASQDNVTITEDLELTLDLKPIKKEELLAKIKALDPK